MHRTGPTAIDFYSPDNSETFFVTAGPAGSSNVTQALQSDIATAAHDPNYSDQRLQGTIQTGPTTGNFNRLAFVNFSATETAAGGTAGDPLVGKYLEGLNSVSQNSFFVQNYAPTEADLTRYSTAVIGMVNSLG